MMDHLTPLVDKAVNLEYKVTSVEHGQVFTNSHEGYGVLAEEYQEVVDAIECCRDYMQDLLHSIRRHDRDCIRQDAIRIYNRAKDAACECVQVAAMAHKMTVTMKYINKEENENV